MVVSSSFAGLARTPFEELSLAALIVAWFNQSDAAMKSKQSNLPQQLLAIGALGLGEKIDPIGDPADRNRRLNNFHYKGNNVSRQTPMVARHAIALAASAGSCSGAFVNLLNRAKIKNIDPARVEREQDLLARSLLSQLGYSIMPPDSSCLHVVDPTGQVRP
ncbi:hypothetical protein DBR17_02770 [Sphingomonas sp. HMWF008]|nr:hypothetical protein DBR17_02770 [Sphingomonas sp. HMWF008]